MYERALDRPTEVLRWTYGLVPITAGADKFVNLLTDWTKYLHPRAARAVRVRPRTFMRLVGLVEIAAGALVLNRKTARIGAYVVGGWLGAIALDLVSKRSYDIAVRDVVMGIGAITLGRLLAAREHVRELDAMAPGTEWHPRSPEPPEPTEPINALA